MDQFVSSFSNQLEVQQKSGRCAELPQKAVGIVAVRQYQWILDPYGSRMPNGLLPTWQFVQGSSQSAPGFSSFTEIP